MLCPPRQHLIQEYPVTAILTAILTAIFIGAGRYPGGQVIGRPPRTWACACHTVWPASAPVLKTTR